MAYLVFTQDIFLNFDSPLKGRFSFMQYFEANQPAVDLECTIPTNPKYPVLIFLNGVSGSYTASVSSELIKIIEE